MSYLVGGYVVQTLFLNQRPVFCQIAKINRIKALDLIVHSWQMRFSAISSRLFCMRQRERVAYFFHSIYSYCRRVTLHLCCTYYIQHVYCVGMLMMFVIKICCSNLNLIWWDDLAQSLWFYCKYCGLQLIFVHDTSNSINWVGNKEIFFFYRLDWCCACFDSQTCTLAEKKKLWKKM